MDTYIIAATQVDGSKLWQLVDTVEAGFIQGSVWRSQGCREFTIGTVKPYDATIKIVVDGQTFELPIPDAEAG
jgi:hypothetical protein